MVSATAIASPNRASTMHGDRNEDPGEGFRHGAGAGRDGRRSVCQQLRSGRGASVAGSAAGIVSGHVASAAAAEPDDAPRERVLEEAGVEQRVHERARGGRPQDRRRRSRSRAGDELERPGRGGEEPERRGRSRRRRARRAPSAASCATRSGSAIPSATISELARGWPPTPTPAIGALLGTRRAVTVDEARASARDVLCRAAADRRRLRHPRPRASPRARRRGGRCASCGPRRPDRDRERHHEEGDEARLRVGVEEPDEEERDERRSPRPSRASVRGARGSRRGAPRSALRGSGRRGSGP